MEIIPKIHSYWAYLVVLLGISLTVVSIIYFITKKPIDNILRKLALFTLISFHIQLLIGIATYFTSPILESFSNLSTAEIMKNDLARLIKIEHPMMMIAGIIFITIANAKIKKSEVVSVGIVAIISLGILTILSRIPYNLWCN
ncbi:MAG: hypothetical protein ACEQSF_03735 [Solirubrobacteraceae bacterium]